MAAGEGLIGRSIELIQRTARAAVEEVEKRLGQPRKVREQAKERAAVAQRMLVPLLKRENGVTPFPAARTKAVLKAVRNRTARTLKGTR